MQTRFLFDFLAIVLIDLLLAGDNALIIAMAVRALPHRQRRIGIACGAGLAVFLRVGITFLAAQLLAVKFVQLLGGAFVIWIAVKVLSDANSPAGRAAPPTRLLQAIGMIVFADLTMSTDNILAVAGASKGNLALIVFGLGLSIPVVVFASSLLAVLMDRYPLLVYLGAAILGKVGGEMILTDPFLAQRFHPSEVLRYATEAALALAIVVTGRLLGQQPETAKP